MLFWMPSSGILRTYLDTRWFKTKRIAAVKQFATPCDVKTVKQFLGLASFYHKFVPNFARIAEPLHNLTRKSVQFEWTIACKDSFNCLKKKLIEGPMLVYPKDFMLEMDANKQGLGAVLSQVQYDGKCHPVSYASQALSPKNAIMQLQYSRHLQLCGL